MKLTTQILAALAVGGFNSSLAFATELELPASSPATEAEPAQPTSTAAAAPAEPASALPAWLAPLRFALFVDAYATFQSNGPGTRATLSGHRAFSGQGANLRSENGFGLSWLGFDLGYDAGAYGAVANVRFGQAVALYHHRASADNDAVFGVDRLTQAYVFWKPLEPLALQLGMFTSPFGVEALESWKNPNYTISALYVYGQPSWHMGLKANWQLNSAWSVMGLIVNGVNSISEAQEHGGLDQSPNLGASVGYAPSKAFSCGLGGLFALDNADNDDAGFDAFVDLVSTLKLAAWTTSLNADFIWTRGGAPSGKNRQFWGGSLTTGYRFTPRVALAARGEYLRDDANFDGRSGDLWQLLVGTLTLDLQPVRHVPNLIVRFENRAERSNQRIFGHSSRGTEATEDDTYRRTWFQSVLGVVVTTTP